jgi:hypothetical protein
MEHDMIVTNDSRNVKVYIAEFWITSRIGGFVVMMEAWWW